MRLPTVTDYEAKRIAIATMTGYHQEHNPNDTHGTINATGKISERGRAVAIGDSISVFFTPTDFTANGTMTWTVAAAGVGNFSYSLIGSRMFVDYYISASVIGGVLNTALFIKIPGGFYAARTTYNPCRVVDNAVPAAGIALVVPGAVGTGDQIQIFRNDVANWTATPIVQGQINFEVRTA